MSKHRPNDSNCDETSGITVSRRELVALRREAGRVTLAAPVAAAASLAGPYVSPNKGRGMEFDEVRAYQPGDEVRNIDWHVTARTGRVHSKLFSEERERPVLVALDTSPSMQFGTRTRFKSVAAARAAAVIAWTAADAGDRVGGLVTTAGAALFPPRRRQRHLYAMFDAFSAASLPPSATSAKPTALDDAAGASTGDSAARAARETIDDRWQLGAALGRLRRLAEPGSKVFVISDFYELTDDARVHLAGLARYCDVTCVLVYDALEEEPPPPGRYRFSDGTRTSSQTMASGKWREAYVEHFATRRAEIKAHCRRHRITLLPLRTDEEPAELLARSEASTARGPARGRASA